MKPEESVFYITVRRSKAPSLTSNASTSGLAQILQSSENHVEELKKVGAMKSNQPQLDNNLENTVRWSAIYGKSSTKKHKTFAEDGIIELNQQGFLILKNSAGKFVCKDEKGIYTSEMEDGKVITMGGYDIQIGEKYGQIQQTNLEQVPKVRTKKSQTKFNSPFTVVDKPKSPKPEKRVYAVVWGPMTTKKHKTFNDDGVLEIEGKIMRLKDTRGKTVAVNHMLKVCDVQEGEILTIENKELEIIELLGCNNHQSSKRESTVEKHSEAKKKRMNVPVFISPMQDPEAIASAESSDCSNSVTNQVDQENFNLFTAPTTCDTISNINKYEILEENTNFQQNPNILLPRQNKTLFGKQTDKDIATLTMPEPPYELQFKYSSGRPINPVLVPRFLASQLRPHQREGVEFLYKCVMGFHTINDVNILGAILADEMGLGKTIQTITLLYVLLKQNPYNKMVPFAKRVLILTPSSLVDNWKNEIIKWLEHERIYSFEVSQKNNAAKFAISTHIPIMIVSYEMFMKQFNDIKEINFDLMVCDEGHRLKNSSTKIGQLVDQMNCKRRVLLTGTPIQNDLQEFYALINFVNPGVLGTYQEFKSRYETPIVQSEQTMILPQFKQLGQERANELNEITEFFVLRRTQEILKEFLPKKQEVVVMCAPSDLQKRLYTYVLEYYNTQKENMEKSISPLTLIRVLKKICNQPSLLTSQNDSDCNFLQKCLPAKGKISVFDASKLELVQFLLNDLSASGEKIVLVSNYTSTLDIMASMCNNFEYKFVRLDGKTPTADRGKIVKCFNDPSSDIFIFLLSSKAGGTGLNLIGANRLILFDNDWNPATDLQALSRIWRDGQVRDVFIYRLLTAGTIEEKIFQRQMSKTSLGDRVMDSYGKQSTPKFSDNELRELFTIPEDFNICNTHEMIQCDCVAIGDIPDESFQEFDQKVNESSSESEDDGFFKIRTKKCESKKPKKTLQVHELMRWEHHQQPIDPSLLDELYLTECSDIITFMFRNVTEYKST